MSRVALGVLCGLAFGAVAVALMLPLSFPDKRRALTAAFLDRFAIGFVITVADVGWPGWAVGLFFGLLLSVPPALITKAWAPILGLGAIGGTIIGLVVAQPTPSIGSGLTPMQSAVIADSVREFAAQVARDVTAQGPSAWSKLFSTSPDFFMASEGQLMFPSGDSAARGIAGLERAIVRIALQWRDSVRVDPIAPGLAVLGATYREVRIDRAGHRVEERGYVTGVVEDRNGRWRFRDAHWSVAATGPSR